MAAIAGVGAEILVLVADVAFGIMILVEDKICRMVESGRNPFVGIMAFGTIIFQRSMEGIIRHVMAVRAVIFIKPLNEVMVEFGCGFPVLRIMAVSAVGRKLGMKFSGWFAVAVIALVFNVFAQKRMFKTAV